MKTYISKPIKVKAELFNPNKIEEYREMWAEIETWSYWTELWLAYVLKTLEWKTIIREWDYIVIWTEWEFYPCKKDIFENKYVKYDF